MEEGRADAVVSGGAPDPFVRVVVLNWNSAWYTRRCLESLALTDYPADRMEVVLVDNGSVDGSLERLRDWFPELRVVENGRNLGFAEGCNRAMRDRDGVDAVALVNNDATVDPGWLRALTDIAATDERIGAASARLVLEPGFLPVDVGAEGTVTVRSVRTDGDDVTGALRFDGFEGISDAAWPLDITYRLQAGSGRIWVPAGDGVGEVAVDLRGSGEVVLEHGGAAVRMPSPGAAVLVAAPERTRLINGIGTARNERCEGYDRHYGVPVGTLVEEREPLVDVQGVCGGGALLRSAMLDDVGLFDPTLFAYYEDTDLSWRAARAGWRLVAVPAATIEHAFGASGGSRARGFFHLDRRNWWLTAERNGTAAERRLVRSEVRREVRVAVRANVAGWLKHRRVPSVALLWAWTRIVADHAVAIRRRNRPALGSPGSRPTDRVVGRFQPRPEPSLTAPRPWGPRQVRVDVTALVGPTSSRDWTESGLVTARSLVRSLLQDHRELDVVAVVAAGADALHVAGPVELRRILGGGRSGLAPQDGPIRVHGLAPAGRVRLRPRRDRPDAVVAIVHPGPGSSPIEVSVDPDRVAAGAAAVTAALLGEAERPPTGSATGSDRTRA